MAKVFKCGKCNATLSDGNADFCGSCGVSFKALSDVSGINSFISSYLDEDDPEGLAETIYEDFMAIMTRKFDKQTANIYWKMFKRALK